MSCRPRRRLHGMTELRVHNFSVSLDGFGAGAAQSTDDPLGRGGEQLHEWMFADDMPEVDRRFRDLGTEGIGATIMGRNMFGPVRGPWESAPEWRGWWGEDPPFHHASSSSLATRGRRCPWPAAPRSTS